jgi:hypothetical protein
MKDTINNMYNMQPININQIAFDKLNELLQRCTLNLVTNLTGISRPTLYRWLDPERSLEEMNYRDSAWFILVCETSPKVKMLLSRPPLSHPRLAKRITDGVEDNAKA